MAAGALPGVNRTLDRVRQYVASSLGESGRGPPHALTWVTDWPMFEWNEGEARLEALHHPFTAPNPGDLQVRNLKESSGEAYGAISGVSGCGVWDAGLGGSWRRCTAGSAVSNNPRHVQQLPAGDFGSRGSQESGL